MEMEPWARSPCLTPNQCFIFLKLAGRLDIVQTQGQGFNKEQETNDVILIWQTLNQSHDMKHYISLRLRIPLSMNVKKNAEKLK